MKTPLLVAIVTLVAIFTWWAYHQTGQPTREVREVPAEKGQDEPDIGGAVSAENTTADDGYDLSACESEPLSRQCGAAMAPIVAALPAVDGGPTLDEVFERFDANLERVKISLTDPACTIWRGDRRPELKDRCAADAFSEVVIAAQLCSHTSMQGTLRRVAELQAHAENEIEEHEVYWQTQRLISRYYFRETYIATACDQINASIADLPTIDERATHDSTRLALYIERAALLGDEIAQRGYAPAAFKVSNMEDDWTEERRQADQDQIKHNIERIAEADPIAGHEQMAYFEWLGVNDDLMFEPSIYGNERDRKAEIAIDTLYHLFAARLLKSPGQPSYLMPIVSKIRSFVSDAEIEIALDRAIQAYGAGMSYEDLVSYAFNPASAQKRVVTYRIGEGTQ